MILAPVFSVKWWVLGVQKRHFFPPKKALKSDLFCSFHFTVSSFLVLCWFSMRLDTAFYRWFWTIIHAFIYWYILSHVPDFTELILAYTCPTSILQRKSVDRPMNAMMAQKRWQVTSNLEHVKNTCQMQIKLNRNKNKHNKTYSYVFRSYVLV